ncbi:hypothetical protein AAY473_035892 [Plecturocebus cupreus]
MDESVVLWSRLQCTGTVMAHCSLNFLDSNQLDPLPSCRVKGNVKRERSGHAQQPECSKVTWQAEPPRSEQDLDAGEEAAWWPGVRVWPGCGSLWLHHLCWSNPGRVPSLSGPRCRIIAKTKRINIGKKCGPAKVFSVCPFLVDGEEEDFA